MAVLPSVKVCGINQHTFGAYLVFTIQLIFLVLFGIFVRYGHHALPDAHENDGFQVYPLFMDTHVMIFIGFGFLMTFLKRYSFGGIGFTLLFAAAMVQWAILTFGFLHLEDNKILVDLHSLLSADIATAAPLITMGALLGRTTYVQLIIVGLFELVFFSGNLYLSEKFWMASDAGASMFVHAFGAYFGLAVSFILHCKKPPDGEHEFESKYSSDVYAMIGTVFLWIFWPSFNGAEVEGDSQQRAVINTYLSLAGCCVTSFILSYLFSPEKKFDMVHIQNSTLAGGVAIGASADLMVQPWGALLVGMFTALVSVFGYCILTPFMHQKCKIADTCGVHNLHGMPGIIGGVVGAIMAAVASTDLYKGSLYNHYPAMEPVNATSMTGGRTAVEQAGYQLIALGVTLVIAIVGGIITGLVINFEVFDLGSEVEKHKDDNFWKIEEEHDEKHEA